MVHNLLDMAKTHLLYAELSVPDLTLWNSTQVFKLVGNAIGILSEPIRVSHVASQIGCVSYKVSF